MTFPNTNTPDSTIQTIHRLTEKVKAIGAHTEIYDADTVLQDYFDNMESDVTGTGYELIDFYEKSDKASRDTIETLFGMLFGESFGQYLADTKSALEDTLLS